LVTSPVPPEFPVPSAQMMMFLLIVDRPFEMPEVRESEVAVCTCSVGFAIG
jgi:hypothetical protein